MTVKINPLTPDSGKPLLLYDSVFESGTVTVSSETTDGAGLNAIEDTTFDEWLASSATAYLSVDYGSDVFVDCIGVAAHDLFTQSATISVEYSNNNVDWTSIWTVTPSDNSTIIGIFTLTKARYWRVAVTSGPASIGVIRLGRRLVIPTGVLSGHVGINHAKRVDVLSNMSLTGQFIGTKVVRRGADATIDFGLLETDYVDSDVSDFESHYNDGRPFFYAGSLSKYPNDIGFCKRPSGASEIRPSYEENGLMMPVAFDVEVYIDVS